MHVTGTPSSKIELRINKMIERLSIRTNEMLPLILSDDTKKEELHMLRKKCKKMRYILEVLPENQVKKYTKKIGGAIGRKDLKETQEMLGSIHDSDITIEYLQNSRSRFAKLTCPSKRRADAITCIENSSNTLKIDHSYIFTICERRYHA